MAVLAYVIAVAISTDAKAADPEEKGQRLLQIPRSDRIIAAIIAV
jgi:hypothetical protein